MNRYLSLFNATRELGLISLERRWVDGWMGGWVGTGTDNQTIFSVTILMGL